MIGIQSIQQHKNFHLFIAGDLFLRDFYSVFDMDNKRAGLMGPTQHATNVTRVGDAAQPHGRSDGGKRTSGISPGALAAIAILCSLVAIVSAQSYIVSQPLQMLVRKHIKMANNATVIV